MYINWLGGFGAKDSYLYLVLEQDGHEGNKLYVYGFMDMIGSTSCKNL